MHKKIIFLIALCSLLVINYGCFTPPSTGGQEPECSPTSSCNEGFTCIDGFCEVDNLNQECTSVMEICTNNLDDDCDNLIDCADSDCSNNVECEFVYPEKIPIRGLMLSMVPDTHPQFDKFIDFIKNDLREEGVNTIVFSINYEYQFNSHPELNDEHSTISYSAVKRVVSACKEAKMRCFPYMQLFSHQKCYGVDQLLNAYPEFDANPSSSSKPAKPTTYCRSWNIYHPDLHDVAFDLVDEMIDVWEADAFHIGFDEITMYPEYETQDYAGTPYYANQTIREMFSDELNVWHEHLTSKGIEVWLWGDWFNKYWYWGEDIPRDNIIINDWHYREDINTPERFSEKGFDVVSCPWNVPEVGLSMVDRYINPEPVHEEHFKGMFQTTWRRGIEFMHAFQHQNEVTHTSDPGEDMCFDDGCFDWNALGAAKTLRAVMQKIKDNTAS